MRNRALEFPLWRVPVILAALTFFGLFDALLVDSPVARVVAWAALIVPLGVTIRCIAKARRRTPVLDGAAS